ncbi:hypothetical protein C2I36_16190, partial [Rhodobacteraceae bacterium WD3A24]
MPQDKSPDPQSEPVHAPGGMAAAQGPERFSGGELALLALSVIWLAGVGGALWLTGSAPFHWLAATLAAVVPAALIWNVAVLMRRTRHLRAEMEQMRSILSALRKSSIAHAQGAGTTRPAMAPAPAPAPAPQPPPDAA